jgi:uncharacterized metal-binding protein
MESKHLIIILDTMARQIPLASQELNNKGWKLLAYLWFPSKHFSKIDQ